MPKSIKDMRKPTQGKTSTDMPKVTPEQERDVANLINRYSGKSDNELMSELLQVTSQQKRNGTLDTAQIDAAANSILPMLNEEQVRKLQSILNQIR
ncbi:MAG: hypothetical protein J1E60_02865 [Christensenellaceae bacterium]|nr:hypothetical protein [Christensenellaceae bacterium]